MTIEAFIRLLASSDPVPGGGSASAVAGAIGAALVAMGAALSEGRPRYAAHAGTPPRAGAQGKRLPPPFLTPPGRGSDPDRPVPAAGGVPPRAPSGAASRAP